MADDGLEFLAGNSVDLIFGEALAALREGTRVV
jgi:hypothetical protein